MSAEPTQLRRHRSVGQGVDALSAAQPDLTEQHVHKLSCIIRGPAAHRLRPNGVGGQGARPRGCGSRTAKLPSAVAVAVALATAARHLPQRDDDLSAGRCAEAPDVGAGGHLLQDQRAQARENRRGPSVLSLGDARPQHQAQSSRPAAPCPGQWGGGAGSGRRPVLVLQSSRSPAGRGRLTGPVVAPRPPAQPTSKCSKSRTSLRIPPSATHRVARVGGAEEVASSSSTAPSASTAASSSFSER